MSRLLIVSLLLPAALPATGQGRRDAQKRKKGQQGLQFRLSEGRQATTPKPPVAPATPLASGEIESVLSRLQPIKAAADAETEFAFRDRSLPPPRTGKTITETFPAEAATETPVSASGPLEVLRFAPEGSVPVAPHLSVTFSQPMVAVTSQAEAAQSASVKLRPEVPGQWRWLGTRTLLFEPEGRFPMATEFAAEIPAGTRALSGSALAESKRWKFTTPPVQVKSFVPQGEAVSRNPLFLVTFDQRVDPAAVLKTIRLSSAGRQWKLRLATTDEVEADEAIDRLSKATPKGHWLAFRAVNDAAMKSEFPLPPATKFAVTIGPGTPSAEGPRTTATEQKFSFSTYGALRVKSHECSYDNKTLCEPFDDWQIQFTNPLDADAPEANFDEKLIRIEPPLEGFRTEIYDDTLSISGQPKPLTTYKVTLAPDIRDEFGQKLGATAPLIFRIGRSAPLISGPWQGLHTLDPDGPRAVSYYSINHQSVRVSLYAVTPADWARFVRFALSRFDEKQPPPPGRRVFSQLIRLNARPEETVETRIDLSPALKNGFGHVVLVVSPTKNPYNREPEARVWIQSTQIGLDAFIDNEELTGWATSLKDGRPLGETQLSIFDPLRSGKTETAVTKSDGLARLALPERPASVPKIRFESARVLLAQRGEDTAILPESYSEHWDGQGWYRKTESDELRWHVFDDRAMYRPGEEAHIKGWLRRIGRGRNGDVEATGDAVRSVAFTLKDSRGNEVQKGEATVNGFGGFDAAFKLPTTMNLGYARLELKARDASEPAANAATTHIFQVQEFRRPEYEVSASATAGPHFIGAQAAVTVNAAYFAGGGLADAPVNWRVTATPVNYSPPNHDDFTFGKWEPWWVSSYRSEEARTETFTSRTDAAGKHHLLIDFLSTDSPRPHSVKAEASVSDVNRQQWSAASTLLVHPSDLYVGLRADRTFVQPGEALTGQAIVTDLDGKAMAGREIRLRVARLDWLYQKDELVEQETDAQEFIITSGTEAVPFRVAAKPGGTYRVTATIIDDRARANQSEIQMWVAGGRAMPSAGEVEQEEVRLIPDRKEYHAGDTAELLVQAPFYPAEGVMTLRRAGLIATERFTISSPSHTLRVPIREEWTPNIHVQVDLTGATARPNDKGQPDKSLPPRPAFASGEISLKIPPLERKLRVTATPRQKGLEPGGETTVDVEVKDATGNAVSKGEVALVMVDEAVLALTDYKLRDPMQTFYTERGEGVTDHHSREQILLANREELMRAKRASAFMPPPPTPVSTPDAKAVSSGVVSVHPLNGYGALAKAARFGGGSGMGAGGGSGGPVIRARVDFNPLAAFAASVITDANGRAAVKVKLPDNLTRYRVMAVATDGAKRFGIAESAVTARMPLMVRPSAPRFLNFGDRFELPVMVQNQTDEPMTVDVVVRAVNARLTEAQGKRLTIAANDRAEIRFAATTVKPGTAYFQLAASTVVNDRSFADAAEISLPVWTPATTEAFATYGELDEGVIVQPVKAPANAFTQFGGLAVTTSSTQLQALTDAMIYLMAYPYECSEQLSSRILAVAALRDVLTAFNAEGLPSASEMQQAVARDLNRLEGMQNDDGGFGFWRRGDKSWPYLSIHVAHALQRAQEKGFAVPAPILEKSKKYLRTIESRIPADYGIEVRRTLIAYALYVRHRLNDRDAARARGLMAEAGPDRLSPEAIGWLLPVLSGDRQSQAEVATILRHLGNRVEETAATAHFTTAYTDGAHLLLHSSRRADGIILEALIDSEPRSDLIPKLVRGLLAQRKQGRWMNTQENAFVLLALDRYFRTYENVTPDFVARVWLGEAGAGEQVFKGRSTDRHQLNAPMKYLPGQHDLILSKSGQGRLYYRIGMQYAPADLNLKAADYGFTVERTYEAIDDLADVRRDADGTWHIRAGAQVRVRLTMAAAARRYHVALTDALPAGFEALNPALKVSGEIPKDPKDTTRWWQWFEHQNLRDERVEAFTSLLWEGVYNYAYVARATTPGLFIAPPARAEEMYEPEVFGRSATDRVMIE
ncbi:MAG: alpha-2-macroglobulin family protein [Blastocatellia bacterium]